MNASGRIQLVSIGSGWVVSNRHIPALSRSKDFEVIAIAGQQEWKLEALARKYGIPKHFTGDAAVEAGWLDDCEAVMIGASPQSHYKLVKFCLEHDKHVLVEKPFTLSQAESLELVELARGANLRLCVVHNLQFSDAAQKLDSEIRNGRLGNIVGLHGVQLGNSLRRLPDWYEDLPWGLFFDESPHLLYLLDRFGLGITPTMVLHVESTSGLRTPAVVQGVFSTGLRKPASLYLNFESPVSEWFVFVYGDRRMGVLDIFRDIYFSLPNDKRHRARNILRTSCGAVLGHVAGFGRSGIKEVTGRHAWGYDVVLGRFGRAIREGCDPADIAARDALRINELQFKIIDMAVEA